MANRRVLLSLLVLMLLGAFVGLGAWLQGRKAAPHPSAQVATIVVTSGADRGAGSLREALFIAAAAKAPRSIVIETRHIELATPLPPLVNPHGVRLSAAEPGVTLDAAALPETAVLDVAAPHVSIEGLVIRDCKGSALVVRGSDFKLQGATISACDVGIDIAENASEVLIEGNRLAHNRVGVRLAGSSRHTSLLKNAFQAQREAGIWAVRAQPDSQASPVSVRDNRFTDETVGMLVANIAVAAERNEFLNARKAALHLMGRGALARGNRISGGSAMGVIVEDAQGTVVESNEIDGVQAYGIMLKRSADVLLQANRIHNSGYGLAFVLGTRPSTALGNTIIEPRFNGIDVIGDSPVLRDNEVVRPRKLALKVSDFKGTDGRTVRAQPFLEGNNFDAKGLLIAAGSDRSGRRGTMP